MLNKNYEVKQIGELRTLEIYLYGEIQSDYYDWWTGKLIESKTSANYVRKAIDEAGTVDQIMCILTLVAVQFLKVMLFLIFLKDILLIKQSMLMLLLIALQV